MFSDYTLQYSEYTAVQYSIVFKGKHSQHSYSSSVRVYQNM